MRKEVRALQTTARNNCNSKSLMIIWIHRLTALLGFKSFLTPDRKLQVEYLCRESVNTSKWAQKGSQPSDTMLGFRYQTKMAKNVHKLAFLNKNERIYAKTNNKSNKFLKNDGS